MADTWTVKCPRCKRKWEYKNTTLKSGPMYKYCGDCTGTVEAYGGVEGRGVKRCGKTYKPNPRTMGE